MNHTQNQDKTEQNSVCLSCSFGDIDLMRNNGYTEDHYIFCEQYDEIVDVKQTCFAWRERKEEDGEEVSPELLEKFLDALIKSEE